MARKLELVAQEVLAGLVLPQMLMEAQEEPEVGQAIMAHLEVAAREDEEELGKLAEQRQVQIHLVLAEVVPVEVVLH